MSTAQVSLSKNGTPMHYSAGAVIRHGNQYLLIDRTNPPFGYACVGGHVDINETPAEAVAREVSEESGLIVESSFLLFEEELDWNTCKRGITVHHWFVFECQTSGKIIKNERETKSIDWYTVEKIKKLSLEPAWEYWFKKMNII